MAKAQGVANRKRGERCGVSCGKDTLPGREAERLTHAMEVLAHPVRLQILAVLLRHEGRACVCDVEAAVPVKQPTVSHHLKLLREAGLVTAEREGLWAYYRVRREKLAELRTTIARGLEELG